MEVSLKELFPELLGKLSLRLLLGTFLPLDPLGPSVQIVLLGATNGLGEGRGGRGQWSHCLVGPQCPGLSWAFMGLQPSSVSLGLGPNLVYPLPAFWSHVP